MEHLSIPVIAATSMVESRVGLGFTIGIGVADAGDGGTCV
jgi:hypothetical protein